MKVGQCRLCKLEKEICKSHIIPEAFHKPILDGNSWFVMMSTVPDVPTKRTARQLWERLLCRDCEERLKVYEDYVIESVFQGKNVVAVANGPVLEFNAVVYRKVKLFQLSILWLASISTLRVFNAVNLGPHEEKIRQMLLSDDPGEPNLYPCAMVAIYFEEDSYQGSADFIGQPECVYVNGVRTYRFEFGSCIWIYFVSSHLDIAKSGGAEWIIRPNGNLRIGKRNVRDVKYLDGYFAEFSKSGPHPID